VTVYLAWTSHPPSDLMGPWEDVRTVAPGLVLFESAESLSAVYHAVKWALPDEAALVVTRLDSRPKSRGLLAGTTAWLRSRIPSSHS
jgi:hypothetical protein